MIPFSTCVLWTRVNNLSSVPIFSAHTHTQPKRHSHKIEIKWRNDVAGKTNATKNTSTGIKRPIFTSSSSFFLLLFCIVLCWAHLRECETKRHKYRAKWNNKMRNKHFWMWQEFTLRPFIFKMWAPFVGFVRSSHSQLGTENDDGNATVDDCFVCCSPLSLLLCTRRARRASGINDMEHAFGGRHNKTNIYIAKGQTVSCEPLCTPCAWLSGFWLSWWMIYNAYSSQCTTRTTGER